MRSLAVALAAVGMVAASAFGAVNVNISSSPSSATVNTGAISTAGGSLTVYVWAQTPTASSGVLALAGSISSSASGIVTATGQKFVWRPAAMLDGLLGIGDLIAAPTSTVPGFGGVAPYPNYTYDGLGNPTSWDGNYLYSPVCPLGQPAQTSPGALSSTWNTGGTGGADGGMTALASGQCYMSQSAAATSTGTAFVRVGQYTVTATNNGTTTLSFVDSGGVANASANNGWFTAGIAIGDDGLGTMVPLVLTVTNQPSPGVSYVSSLPTFTQTTNLGKGAMNRVKSNFMEMTFNGTLPALAGTELGTSIKVFQMAAGSVGTVTGSDLSSHFDAAIINGNTLKLKQKLNDTILVNKTWYVVQIQGWAGVNDCLNTCKFGLMIGDGNRDGKTLTGDVTTTLGYVNTLTSRTDESAQGAYACAGNAGTGSGATSGCKVLTGDVTTCLAKVNTLQSMPTCPW